MALDARMLEMLVCPLTKETLYYDKEAKVLISRGAKLAYPIHDGIPVLLLDEAQKFDEF